MQMRPHVQLKSVIKALTDVVLPAVDPGNQLAQEQARLAIGLLNLLVSQLPQQYAFDRDELQRLLACSEQLRAQVSGGDGTMAALECLSQATKRGATVLAGAVTTPEALRQAVRALRAATGEVVTQTWRDGDAACRSNVRKLVLSMSKEQLLRDRSMLLMQGWEPDPRAVPPLENLIAP